MDNEEEEPKLPNFPDDIARKLGLPSMEEFAKLPDFAKGILLKGVAEQILRALKTMGGGLVDGKVVEQCDNPDCRCHSQSSEGAEEAVTNPRLCVWKVGTPGNVVEVSPYKDPEGAIEALLKPAKEEIEALLPGFWKDASCQMLNVLEITARTSVFFLRSDIEYGDQGDGAPTCYANLSSIVRKLCSGMAFCIEQAKKSDPIFGGDEPGTIQ